MVLEKGCLPLGTTDAMQDMQHSKPSGVPACFDPPKRKTTIYLKGISPTEAGLASLQNLDAMRCSQIFPCAGQIMIISGEYCWRAALSEVPKTSNPSSLYLTIIPSSTHSKFTLTFLMSCFLYVPWTLCSMSVTLSQTSSSFLQVSLITLF